MPKPEEPPAEKAGKGNILNSFKNKIGGRNSGEDFTNSGLRSGLERLISSANRSSGSGGVGPLLPGGNRQNKPHGHNSDAQPTPESDISTFLSI